MPEKIDDWNPERPADPLAESSHRITVASLMESTETVERLRAALVVIQSDCVTDAATIDTLRPSEIGPLLGSMLAMTSALAGILLTLME